MAVEIIGTLEQSSEVITGRESWELDFYKERYNRVVEELEVYKIKPWDIVKGHVLVLRDVAELEKLDLQEAIPCGWEADMEQDLKDKEFVVDDALMTLIESNRNCIIENVNEQGKVTCFVSLPMLVLKDGSVGTQQVDKKEEVVLPPLHTLKQGKKDPTIIAEMISKVDRKRLQKLLSINASNDGGEKFFVKDHIVDKFLQMWAEAKYDFYVTIMDRNLEISKDIELEVDKVEMESMIKCLSEQFPKYGVYLDKINSKDFIENKFTYLSGTFSEYAQPYYSTGMKLSKFFSTFLGDNAFDIELSKIMQNKKVVGTLVLSIDPYDYMTMSTNKHGWKSCQRIYNSPEWGTAPTAYMVDPTTLVAYRTQKGKEYDYNLHGFKFEGNSKTWRQLVYIDQASCNVIFSREYPKASDKIAKEMRVFVEDKIANFLNVDSLWKVFQNKFEGRLTGITNLAYIDPLNDWNFRFARLSDSREKIANFKVAADIPCAVCGSFESVERGEIIVCDDCVDGDDD